MKHSIVDCHRHLSLDEINKTYDKAAKALLLDMESNGIYESVVIADNVAGSGTADIETLLNVFKKNENILFIGTIDPFDQSENKLSTIENYLAKKKIIGLKLFNGHDKLYLTDKKCFSTYELCNKYNVPLMIHTGANNGDPESAKYNDPKMIVEIAKKYPMLKIIISHYFWPKIDYCFEITKNIDNIYFDTSALADDEVIEASGGIGKIKAVLTKTILDRSNSVLFGTDYPMCNSDSHIKMIQSLDIRDLYKKRMFSNNAVDCFGL